MWEAAMRTREPALQVEQQFHDRMTSRARPKIDRIATVPQAAVGARRKSIGAAVPRSVKATRVFDEIADEVGIAQFDEQVVGSIVVADHLDHFRLGLGRIAGRIEGTDERDRRRVREAVELLVQTRSRDLAERRAIETTAHDAQPSPESGLEHFDHRIIGVRRPRMAVERYAYLERRARAPSTSAAASRRSRK